MTFEQKLKALAAMRGVSLAQIAKEVGQSAQNFHKKLKRDTFTLDERKQIAQVLEAEFVFEFRTKDFTI